MGFKKVKKYEQTNTIAIVVIGTLCPILVDGLI
jgi:hypothetical protein